MRFAFFGSSLVSSYWNGACTYYRGLIRCLHERGHDVTFYEPIAYRRQEHRDIDDPDYARVVVYPAETEAHVLETVQSARGTADVVVKCSGVGVHDHLLEAAVLELGAPVTIFWDVDAPATPSSAAIAISSSTRCAHVWRARTVRRPDARSAAASSSSASTLRSCAAISAPLRATR